MATDYNKTDGPLPTTRKQTGHNLQKTQSPLSLRPLYPLADKHNIQKGKTHSHCRLLPEDIVCKSTQRNNIRRANTCDQALELLNGEITSDLQKHKQNIWKEHFDAHWDHNTHTLWKTIHGLSNRAPPHTLNTSITFNNKIATAPKHIANCFTKQFTDTQHTKHTDTLTEQHTTYKQGSHSHGRSWKVMESHEKKTVMESHGKVMETEENK